MVLVSYRLDNYVSILQTKLSDREGHEARRMGLEAMPLDQHIKRRHREREAGVKVLPAPMHDPLEVADERQHREHRLHQHAVLPLAALTHFEIGGIALGGLEAGITVGEATGAVPTAFCPSAPPTRPGYLRILRLSRF